MSNVHAAYSSKLTEIQRLSALVCRPPETRHPSIQAQFEKKRAEARDHLVARAFALIDDAIESLRTLANNVAWRLFGHQNRMVVDYPAMRENDARRRANDARDADPDCDALDAALSAVRAVVEELQIEERQKAWLDELVPERPAVRMHAY